MYNFIVYDNETKFVQQITSTTAPNLPFIPEKDGVTAIHIDFYNEDISGCYYADGVFYEDAELTVVITDPATYVKPYVEPEPFEPTPRYTLDEASEIITQEVANYEV